MSSSDGQYEKISPTAYLTAYGRALTDIPFAQDIFKEFERIMKREAESPIPVACKTPETAPRFEARYKLINRLVKRSGVTQVLEIASGLSSRGLEMTNSPHFIYVEQDLTGIAHLKKEIVNAITARPAVGVRANLSIEDGSALDLPSLLTAASHLEQAKPVAIITEGLLRYLSFKDKTIVAKNISTLLAQFGGVWITSDTSAKRSFKTESAAAREQSEKIKLTTGINTDLNLFKDNKDAKRYFETLGFTVEDHSLVEAVGDLVSPKRLALTSYETRALVRGKHVYVMRLHK